MDQEKRVQALAKAQDLSEEVLLADARSLYTIHIETRTSSGLISGEHLYRLAKRVVKPAGRQLVCMAARIKCPAEEHWINWGLKLDRVDYAEKLQATVAAHSTANRRCRTSL